MVDSETQGRWRGRVNAWFPRRPAADVGARFLSEQGGLQRSALRFSGARRKSRKTDYNWLPRKPRRAGRRGVHEKELSRREVGRDRTFNGRRRRRIGVPGA